MIYKLHVTQDILQDVFAGLIQSYHGKDMIHLVLHDSVIKLKTITIAGKCAIFQHLLQSLKIQYEIVEN